jgi:hypothetical protein
MRMSPATNQRLRIAGQEPQHGDGRAGQAGGGCGALATSSPSAWLSWTTPPTITRRSAMGVPIDAYIQRLAIQCCGTQLRLG